MAWKTEILERIRQNGRIISMCDEKEEMARANGQEERADSLRRKSNNLERWIWGAIDVLEAIGYEIKYDDDASVKSIDGEFAQEYRVRYEKTDINEIASLVCHSSAEVCGVIDRCKEFGIEYKALGIDTRVVFPNGERSGWNKLFDF